MRKVGSKIEDIINEIKTLQGSDIDLEITKGRKKSIKYSGTIENIYPSIFTVRSLSDKLISHSYSYADVLCGDVSFALKQKLNDLENNVSSQ